MNNLEREISWSTCRFQHTRSNPRFYLIVGLDPELQDTSRVMFCDNLPSTAPSVRGTESAARHYSAASRLNRRSTLVTALLRR